MEVSSSSFIDSTVLFTCFSVAPSAPVNPKYTIISNDTASFYVLFEWMRPLSDGGLVVTNYTTMLRLPDSLLTFVGTQTRFYIALMYNQLYSLHITATSCAGEGPPVNISNIHHGSQSLLSIEVDKS